MKVISLLAISFLYPVLLSAQEADWVDRGWKKYKNGEYDSAIHYYNLYIQGFPAETVALKFRGMAYASKGEYQKAILDLTNALKYYQLDSSYILYLRSSAFLNTQNLNEAIADASLALTLYYDSARLLALRTIRASAYFDLKKFNQAELEADFILERDSLSPTCLYIKAYVLRKSDPKKSVRYAEKVTTLAPKFAYGYILKASGEIDLGLIKNAVSSLEKAEEFSHNNPVILTDIALYYGLAFKYFYAKYLANKVIAMDNTLSRAYLAKGFAECGLYQYLDAIGTLAKSIAMDPTVGLTYVKRGQCYYMLKKYSHAKSDLIKAIQLAPDMNEAYVFLGYTYNAQGNRTEACKTWKLAFQYGAKDIEFELERNCR